MPDSTKAAQRVWRVFRWRALLLVLTFGCGFCAFHFGVEVSDRPGIAEGGVLTQAYYTVGLFVLGGLDLGVPVGGPTFTRVMLWFAYFAAPTITASAVIEGVLRAIRPRAWALRSMRDHIVIAGCGKLTMQYLERLRRSDKRVPVVIVESRSERANLDEARDIYGAHIVNGEIHSEHLLRALRLDHARRVVLLTGDDFANLDSAAKIVSMAPNLGQRILAHVSDLHFMRVMRGTHVADEIDVFNTHQIAAEHLVETRLLAHFQATDPLDTVVIAGFGRFGQTVLDALQREASGKFDRVVMIDVECTRRALLFEEQVGFVGKYERQAIDGDLRDPQLWRELAATLEGEPVLIIGSGDDGVNLHTALWLKQKYPSAYVVARSFRRSAFAKEVSKMGHFDVFSVAELVSQSIPDRWL